MLSNPICSQRLVSFCINIQDCAYKKFFIFFLLGFCVVLCQRTCIAYYVCLYIMHVRVVMCVCVVVMCVCVGEIILCVYV